MVAISVVITIAAMVAIPVTVVVIGLIIELHILDEVARAVVSGRIEAANTVAGGILAQVGVTIAAPLVKAIAGNSAFQIVASEIRWVQSERLVSLDRDFPPGIGIAHAEFAAPHCQK
jgi:hypothetical protein